MIYIKRNPALIPAKVIKAAEKAQLALDALPEDARKEYIEKRSKLWGAFKPYLAEMSYGKCWYSEANDPQSFFDVDHFRPKKEAKRSGSVSDDGYPWLAFSWDNFRYSAARSNRLNTDEENKDVVGKGSWFPLCTGSPIASWAVRCVANEAPVILDPTKKEDVRLIEVAATGKMEPSRYCLGQVKKFRVTESVKYLGLNLPELVGARMQVMRDIQFAAEEMLRIMAIGNGDDNKANIIAEALPIDRHIENIKLKTRPCIPYAAAIRAQLVLMGLGDLCLREEDFEGAV